MIVRPATAADIDRLVDLGEKLHAESRLPFPPLSRKKTRENLEILLGSGAVFSAVAERDGKIVGALNGFMSSYFFAEPPIAIQEIFYVVPEARGSMAAYRLIRAFEDWAKERGAWEIQIHQRTNINAEHAERFFERIGYEHMGGTFRKVM